MTQPHFFIKCWKQNTGTYVFLNPPKKNGGPNQPWNLPSNPSPKNLHLPFPSCNFWLSSKLKGCRPGKANLVGHESCELHLVKAWGHFIRPTGLVGSVGGVASVRATRWLSHPKKMRKSDWMISPPKKKKTLGWKCLPKKKVLEILTCFVDNWRVEEPKLR